MAQTDTLLERLDAYLKKTPSSTTVSITKDVAGYNVARPLGEVVNAPSLLAAIEKFLDSVS